AMGGILASVDHNYDEAENQVRQAEELAPGDAGLRCALEGLLFSQGRLSEAEEAGRKAQALDPLSMQIILIRVLIARGKYDEAEALFRQAIAKRPNAVFLHSQLTHIYLLKGDNAAALKEAQLGPKSPYQDYAIALAQQA